MPRNADAAAAPERAHIRKCRCKMAKVVKFAGIKVD
jgi:hypothetical protein